MTPVSTLLLGLRTDPPLMMDNQPSATTRMPPTDMRATLSVVIPVFNEREWIGRSVRRVVDELRTSPWRAAEVLIVDDGSTDGTAAVLDELVAQLTDADSLSLRVMSQPNRGRFAARLAGVTAASGDYVLFLDSRVLIEPGSLAFLADSVSDHAAIWNAHVDVAVEGNPFARFWDAVTRLAWWRYFGDPKTVSYGVDEFDQYPKGTTCFLARRDVIVRSAAAVTSHYGESKFSNDDTSLIRNMVQEHRIWISPSFRCRYEARSDPRKFFVHAMNRGVVFVDGHLRRESRFAPVILAFYPLSVAAAATALWHWWAPALLLGATSAAATGLAAWRRLPAAHVASVAVITPVFVVAYGVGIWKGAYLLAAKAIQR
jgi:glycosyltransferase involved in cell wall biosynthesis